MGEEKVEAKKRVRKPVKKENKMNWGGVILSVTFAVWAGITAASALMVSIDIGIIKDVLIRHGKVYELQIEGYQDRLLEEKKEEEEKSKLREISQEGEISWMGLRVMENKEVKGIGL